MSDSIGQAARGSSVSAYTCGTTDDFKGLAYGNTLDLDPRVGVVIAPYVRSMRDYILLHYKQTLISELCRQIDAGAFAATAAETPVAIADTCRDCWTVCRVRFTGCSRA